ncbi:MAG: hypothetical protein JNM85_09010 [Chthonomonas sp.]|nr:hypothetical protein [Chthonomonas sp.]
MNVMAFNRAVASNLISMYRIERTLQRSRVSEEAAQISEDRRRKLAEIEQQNARAIRVAQSAIMSSSLDVLA